MAFPRLVFSVSRFTSASSLLQWGSRSISTDLRLWALIAVFTLVVQTALLAEDFVDSRYQYYQEGRNRIRVDSSYSLFELDLTDTLKLDGSLIYSAVSGASPTGLPPFLKGPLPVAELEDDRYAFSLALTKTIGSHALQGSFAYSTESDYISYGYAIQDTILFNEKNTSLLLGFAFSDDTVGATGTNLSKPKWSYDFIVGLNQILGPDDLLTANFGLGFKRGYLSDPYKRVLWNFFFVLPDNRPHHRQDELVFLQWTHFLSTWDASVQTSWRFGHNDWGSNSNTFQITFLKKFFGDRLTLGPSFRYYYQSSAYFYDTEYIGKKPKFRSADYRLAEEETFTYGIQARLYALEERLALDVGYERYITTGLDGKTSQAAFPDANSVTVGLHLKF